MTTRKEHLETWKERNRDLEDFGRRTGLMTTGWQRWRSWAHHPFANTRYFYWTHLPHRPKWEMSECTVGEIGHDSRVDADWGYAYDSCKRCGVTRNERHYAPLDEVEILPSHEAQKDIVTDILDSGLDWDE